MSLARATIAGTLATDPEKRYTQNNAAVTNFVLQVTPTAAPNSRQQSEPFQIKVACWRGLADAAALSLQKGDNVLVDGRLSINAFQGQDGAQKKQYEIDASALSKLSEPAQAILAVSEGSAPPAAAQQSFASPQPAAPANSYATPPATPSNAAYGNPGFSADDFMTEDDIPF